MHTCPRCEAKQANVVSKSPVEGVWGFTYATVFVLPVRPNSEREDNHQS